MLGSKRPATAQQALKQAAKITAAFFLSVEKRKLGTFHRRPCNRRPGGKITTERKAQRGVMFAVSQSAGSTWLETRKQIRTQKSENGFFQKKPFDLSKVLVNEGPDAPVYLSLVSPVAPPPGSLCSSSSCTSSPFWAEPETRWANWWPSLLS